MSSKFTTRGKLQATPKVCKKGPPGWRFVPVLEMPILFCTMITRGRVFNMDPSLALDYDYFDRFLLQYNPIMSWYRRQFSHGANVLAITITNVGADQPLPVVASNWIAGRPPLSDSWSAPLLTKGKAYHTTKEYLEDPDPFDYRYYLIET